jgi:O-antigen/teichoic acid export membrane protein
MNREAYSGPAVKRAGWQFLTGKVTSALLTFFIVLWLVRLLSVVEYGAYVTFVAATELAFAVSFVGLPWLAARYLPEFRVHSASRLLAKLCIQLVAFHALVVLAFAFLLAILLDAYLDWIALAEHRSAAQIYLLVLVVEAIGRFARDGVLGALLQHGIAQTSQVLRNLFFLIFLAALHYNGGLTLHRVACAELAAAAIATLIALGGLFRHLATLKSQPQSVGWVAPTIWRMWPTALKMYAAELLLLANSPQVILNMIQLWLGAGAAATFGFLRNLHDLVWRYLPATLLFGLIRPKLVASYSHARDIADLASNANLAGKLSLLALMPAVAVTAAAGGQLVGWLSGGKFVDTGLLLFGLMLALIPYSQRQLLETVAVATGDAGQCVKAAVAVLAMPLLVWMMLASGMGIWAGVVGIGLGQLLFTLFVLCGVSVKAGYHVDVNGYMRLAASGFISYVGAASAPLASSTVVSMMLIVVGGGLGYLAAIWILRPISDRERAKLLAFLRRKKR